MADRRSEPNRDLVAGRRRSLRESGEVILVALTTVLGLLWAIVLVIHFHGPLSSFGQSLWLMR